jgi:GrpB-like predicted nucleotidyltransferase (UPF0157 family)
MRRVIVSPHNPAWAAAFTRESAALALALGDPRVTFHHIGSTAIPGICAKPIIDLLAVVGNLDELDGRSPQMQALGYEVMGEFGIPGRRYFRRDDATGRRTHQIHAFATGSPNIERHLAFRDFMRTHPDHARRYSDLKRRLAAQHPEDIEAYMDGKDAFIKRMEAMAAAWRQESTDE